MPVGFPPTKRGHKRETTNGFTLVELLVVIAVIAVLLALIAPAFTQVNSARTMTAAAHDIAGVLDNARAYAKANNTYTWVGFYEEQANGANGTAGIGRVILSAVASKDATQIYSSSDPNPGALLSSKLASVGKLLKIDNVYLTVLGSGEVPSREKVTDSSGNQSSVSTEYQVGDTGTSGGNAFGMRSGATNNTTFTYPINTTNPTYKFVKIIQFNPLGDATKIVDSPTQLIEIGLRPARGTTVDTTSKNLAAVQVGGIGGLVRIYQQ